MRPLQSWQLQDAKNRFSEVVERAVHGEPQLVTRRGVEAVVVISADRYRAMTRPKESLVGFLRSSPLAEVRLDLERSKELPREVEIRAISWIHMCSQRQSNQGRTKL